MVIFCASFAKQKPQRSDVLKRHTNQILFGIILLIQNICNLFSNFFIGFLKLDK
jgi:hypothetical protein